MDQQKKLYVALALYGVIGLLIWMTIDDIPIPIPLGHEASWTTLRRLTLAVLGFFAVLTLVHWKIDQVRARRDRQNGFEG
jgi:uncharacterized membrane protein